MVDIFLAIIIIGMFLFGFFVVRRYSSFIGKNYKGSCRDRATTDESEWSDRRKR